MSTMNQYNSHNGQFGEVMEKINEIAAKTQDGNYIYRGESQCFGKVRSSLYRAYVDLGIKNPHDIIKTVEKNVIDRAREHLDKTENKVLSSLLNDYEVSFQFSDRQDESSDDEKKDGENECIKNDIRKDIYSIHKDILEKAKELVQREEDLAIRVQLQHYGCPTNLIDFTNDYMIALFFACCNDPIDDGRIVFLNRDPGEQEDCKIIDPPPIIDRVKDQRSVFVDAYKGFIEIKGDRGEICIPQSLKEPLKEYLLSHHGISDKTVYNDLHGFIQLLRIYAPEYQRLYEAQIYKQRGDSAIDPTEKDDWYRKAIETYTTIISQKPDFWEAYYQRAEIHFNLEDYKQAICDYNHANTYYCEDAEFFVNRGKAYYFDKNFHSAVRDYKKAIQLSHEHPIMIYFHLCQALISDKEWLELEEAFIVIEKMDKDEEIANFFLEIRKYLIVLQIHNLPENIQNILDRHPNQ